MPFHIILENVTGKRAEAIVDDLERAPSAIIRIMQKEELRDGDVIRIVEQSIEELMYQTQRSHE